MSKFLLTIAYDGTNYQGYQLQNDKPTIALMLNKATKEAFGFECKVTGCSRTDSGVHALGFKATVEPKNKEDRITVPVTKIPIAMNVKLPDDIVVLDAKEVSEDFHPRYSVIRKEYVYKIHDSLTPNPFYRNYALEYGKPISDDGINKMNEACSHFLGTHQFDSFMASGSKIEDTTRTVYSARVKRNGDVVEFSVSADGFLYNMVRIMVGTLLKVESGKILPSDISNIILAKNREFSGSTAKPCGLYLKNVQYDS
ncbi:MAG: tRNA pseudouridine(38-40) synthase TruA [Clostridia bacterium]|nr:tRNA pseudouridine(38-40) synthase TruA [Clostridia bacterium]